MLEGRSYFTKLGRGAVQRLADVRDRVVEGHVHELLGHGREDAVDALRRRQVLVALRRDAIQGGRDPLGVVDRRAPDRPADFKGGARLGAARRRHGLGVELFFFLFVLRLLFLRAPLRPSTHLIYFAGRLVEPSTSIAAVALRRRAQGLEVERRAARRLQYQRPPTESCA